MRGVCLNIQSAEFTWQSWITLVVVRMFVAPLPVITLLSAIIPLESDVVTTMLISIRLVGARFAVIPIVVIPVIPIVNAHAHQLRRGADLRCKRRKKRGAQNQSSD